jgi:5-methylcytosine-specific restriction protein A
MLSQIKPTELPLLMNLVKKAGVDVSDWKNFRGGEERAATNPSYCYKWSFVQQGRVVVLNLWYDQMEEKDGSITRSLNMRELATELRGAQKKRAREMDEDIQTAIKDNLPIRAIISLRDNPTESTSNVEARLLDAVTWGVTHYNKHTGECTLERGADHSTSFTEDPPPSQSPEKESNNWTKEELKAAVEAYLDMKHKMQAGEDVNKKQCYRDLSKRFGRSEKAYEYRMQNISYVLSLAGREWVTGLLPAANVGANVAAQIEGILAEVEKRPIMPSVVFGAHVQTYRKKKNIQKPDGVKEPKSKVSQSTQYERDAKVVAWVLNESKGKCECCRKEAPFFTGDGEPFLEVHHVRQLADKGPDTVDNSAALCPNCHREIHYGANSKKLVEHLYSTVTRLVRH